MLNKDHVNDIISLINEIKDIKNKKLKLINDLNVIDSQFKNHKLSEKSYKNIIDKYLKGKKRENVVNEIDESIIKKLDEIKTKNETILNSFKTGKKNKVKKIHLDLGKSKKIKSKKHPIEKEYEVYEENKLAKFSNRFFKDLSKKIVNKYPSFFENLFKSITSSSIKTLSVSYVSIMLFFSSLAFVFSFLLFFIIFYGNLLFSIFTSFFLSIFISIIVFSLIYIYPANVVRNKKRKIKNDLPFVVMHMAAVAGSGAQPISMFNLILDSEEYKGIKGEVKKIVNYVNLFGYDLISAIRSVAITTPSRDFREYLVGLTTTIESGGDLKTYLDAKASEMMNTYRLERKKYLESLSTYADVYTGILIAAPLLFFVTLAIIQMLGGEIAGIQISTLATIGTYFVLPSLNIGFFTFLNMTQPE